MSGHSHFATIKRQKGLKDAAKGNIFGKLSKNISIAIKSGGGTNPDMNFKLRIAIDKAKEFNMPKDNIDRILKSAESKMESIDEITYEGFGPFGVGVLVEVVTDNKNRSAQEFKNIFEKAGGNIAGPGAVSYNFEQKGILLVKKTDDADSQMLSLIDLGVLDIEDIEDGLQLVVKYEDLKSERQKIEDAGFTVVRAEIAMIPKNYVEIDNPDHVEKVTKFLETLEDHDDVQKVYSNF
jgi:YebC/PmpR family DNA-binding regulatory protein